MIIARLSRVLLFLHRFEGMWKPENIILFLSILNDHCKFEVPYIP